MLSVDDVRFWLKLTVDDISDEDIQRYINDFTLRIYQYVGHVDCPKLISSPLFDEALLAGIACHLAMTSPEIVISIPKRYRVGDTEEEFSSKTTEKLPTWCEKYQSLLEILIKHFSKMKKLQTFRRRGLSTHNDWRG